jgi:hypothetical protein
MHLLRSLRQGFREIPDKENLLLLGDFNDLVGADHTSWARCIGHFGLGKLNENGQRLLELCSFNDLAITNTFYPTKPHHSVLATSKIGALAPAGPCHH